jgi:hypothetical protein
MELISLTKDYYVIDIDIKYIINVIGIVLITYFINKIYSHTNQLYSLNVNLRKDIIQYNDELHSRISINILDQKDFNEVLNKDIDHLQYTIEKVENELQLKIENENVERTKCIQELQLKIENENVEKTKYIEKLENTIQNMELRNNNKIDELNKTITKLQQSIKSIETKTKEDFEYVSIDISKLLTKMDETTDKLKVEFERENKDINSMIDYINSRIDDIKSNKDISNLVASNTLVHSKMISGLNQELAEQKLVISKVMDNFDSFEYKMMRHENKLKLNYKCIKDIRYTIDLDANTNINEITLVKGNIPNDIFTLSNEDYIIGYISYIDSFTKTTYNTPNGIEHIIILDPTRTITFIKNSKIFTKLNQHKLIKCKYTKYPIFDAYIEYFINNELLDNLFIGVRRTGYISYKYDGYKPNYKVLSFTNTIKFEEKILNYSISNDYMDYNRIEDKKYQYIVYEKKLYKIVLILDSNCIITYKYTEYGNIHSHNYSKFIKQSDFEYEKDTTIYVLCDLIE